MRKIGIVLVSFFSLMASGLAGAADQEFQLGYVYDSWNSNSIFHGQENRIPLSYRLYGDNFSFRLSTAFVSGDYVSDASISPAPPSFQAGNITDTTFQASIDLPTSSAFKSTLIEILNIPTGDTNWETKAEAASVPYIFEPSYYHGRNFGQSLFYTISTTGSGLQWGAGLGFMETTTYYSSSPSTIQLIPWGGFVGMATLGAPLSPSDTLSLRVVHSLPLQATGDPGTLPFTFTVGQSSEFSGQWSSQMGKDKLQLTLSYSIFDRGFATDPTTSIFSEDSESFLGDRFEAKPFFGFFLAPGIASETGLDWKHVFANGYSVGVPLYQGGGDLFGAQQSLTLQVDSRTYLNLAGLYEYIYNNNAGGTITNPVGISYNRVSVGTNVGLKW